MKTINYTLEFYPTENTRWRIVEEEEDNSKTQNIIGQGEGDMLHAFLAHVDDEVPGDPTPSVIAQLKLRFDDFSAGWKSHKPNTPLITDN